MCNRNAVMYMKREVEEGGGGLQKKRIKENIWHGDLQPWQKRSTAAWAEAAAVSVLNLWSDSAGRVAGPHGGEGASKWLYDSCYQV